MLKFIKMTKAWLNLMSAFASFELRHRITKRMYMRIHSIQYCNWYSNVKKLENKSFSSNSIRQRTSIYSLYRSQQPSVYLKLKTLNVNCPPNKAFRFLFASIPLKFTLNYLINKRRARIFVLSNRRHFWTVCEKNRQRGQPRPELGFRAVSVEIDVRAIEKIDLIVLSRSSVWHPPHTSADRYTTAAHSPQPTCNYLGAACFISDSGYQGTAWAREKGVWAGETAALPLYGHTPSAHLGRI